MTDYTNNINNLNINKMKNTKLMLAGLGTFIITWCVLGLIGYLLSDNVSYKECMIHTATIFGMISFGWLPSLSVCYDLDKKLN